MFKKVVVAIELVAALAAVVFVIMLFVAQPSDDDVAAGTSNGGGAYVAETGALPTTGQEIFQVRCSGCHGAKGQGGTGPRLAGTVVDDFPDVKDEIAKVAGGGGIMPSFGGVLSDADIRLVVEYTRTGLGN